MSDAMFNEHAPERYQRQAVLGRRRAHPRQHERLARATLPDTLNGATCEAGHMLLAPATCRCLGACGRVSGREGPPNVNVKSSLEVRLPRSASSEPVCVCLAVRARERTNERRNE